MIASYILSRTLVPTLAMYLLNAHEHSDQPRTIFGRAQQAFDRGFDRVRDGYRGLLTRLVAARAIFLPVFLLICLAVFLLLPFLGQDFFPSTDSGQFLLHIRGKTGLRIEETARLCDLVEDQIRKEVPPAQLANILDNIGMPYSPYNTMHMTSGTIGESDADILVTLTPEHRPTADLRARPAQEPPERDFPTVTFSFLPGRHRDANPELRPALADRRAVPRQGPGRPARHRRARS